MLNKFLQRFQFARALGPVHSEEISKPDLSYSRCFESQMSEADRVALFISRAEKPSSIVHTPSSRIDSASILKKNLESKSKLLVEEENELTQSLQSDFQIVPLDKASEEDIFSASAVITNVDFAIAETASIALSARPTQPRLASTAAEIHFAIIHASQIIADLMDLPQAIEKYYNNKIPTGFTLISGPSKTSDIEMNLVVGVHGPAQMHMIILPD